MHPGQRHNTSPEPSVRPEFPSFRTAFVVTALLRKQKRLTFPSSLLRRLLLWLGLSWESCLLPSGAGFELKPHSREADRVGAVEMCRWRKPFSLPTWQPWARDGESLDSGADVGDSLASKLTRTPSQPPCVPSGPSTFIFPYSDRPVLSSLHHGLLSAF